ncbi:uncharacterized protein [Clytia hemisphaerica]|uniref:SCP domain-containing protein n=1 Tax=Clytia hemisphaerica TaxID=252671 RepID=A0A7M5V3F4_9CNID
MVSQSVHPGQTMADFKNDILKTHNTYRKTHRSNPLKWSNKLQANAQRWADKLAKKGYLQHENQSEEGENIACMKGAELTGERAATMWYDEVKYYDYSKPTFSSKTGHFTQLVWNGSTELGVGRATASNGMQFVVARYNPPGNILGKFPDNVFSSNGKPPPTTSSNNSNNNRTTRNKPEKRQQQPSSDKQTDKDFKNAVLRTHNQLRKHHGSGPLRWNSSLASQALSAAQEAAETNTLRSVDNNKVGQNMAAISGAELTGEKVSNMWYDEEKKYNYREAKFSSSTGSFTQLVWKGTTDLGVGRAFGPNGQTYVVALYQPAGNVRGLYSENVLQSRGTRPGSKKEDQGCGCAIM